VSGGLAGAGKICPSSSSYSIESGFRFRLSVPTDGPGDRLELIRV
jgi:hypothetical protein